MKAEINRLNGTVERIQNKFEVTQTSESEKMKKIQHQKSLLTNEVERKELVIKKLKQNIKEVKSKNLADEERKRKESLEENQNNKFEIEAEMEEKFQKMIEERGKEIISEAQIKWERQMKDREEEMRFKFLRRKVEIKDRMEDAMN
eukprot:Seg4716.5 transcript_id=Seg4716.5/GoldUCD/mRNA.D3Y31 product="hypothetical protein" protein_id=Seg4716.5/GoldUCD/D3Y31